MSVTSSGHVFAVPGAMEAISADVVMVPTDLFFIVEPTWHPITGTNFARHEPADWRQRRVGPSAVDPGIWFIDVARATKDMLEALADALGSIGSSAITPAGGRHLPRVLLPILSTARGGHGASRGEVIDGILGVARRTADRYPIDVAVVAYDRSDYAALQAARRATTDPGKAHPDSRRLAAYARSGDLALFLGAGVSIPAGLPSWDALLDAIAADTDTHISELRDVLDRAELLRKRLGNGLGAAVEQHIRPSRYYSLAHAVLAGLGCREVVTTNFDLLYERAADDARLPVTVLPWDRPVGGDRWLLKLHGDIDHPRDIVLARQDFSRFGADRGPAGALLQTLMMTRHLLVVGASMTDANILRLAHEVMHFRRAHAVKEHIGTVLSLAPEPAQALLWQGEFEWMSAGTREMTTAEAGRALEIFLDELAMFAVTDGSYLLDRRYAAMLDCDEQGVAEILREQSVVVRTQSGAHDEAWDGVRRFLRDHGAEH